MPSAPFDNFPPGRTLDMAIRKTLTRETKLYHDLRDQKLVQEGQMNDARSSSRWLSSALDVTRVVLDSSADVASILNSFVANLSSVISIHGSDQIFLDLKQSLPSKDAAKRSWESVADIVGNLLVQIESLKSVTSSHIECMNTELEAHKGIEQQSKISLDGLTQSIGALTCSINQKRSILHPIRRVPTEILEQIFELATLDERSTLQGELVSRQTVHLHKNMVDCTMPCIPTILASTCRRWRTVALNMALLWSFLRVPTLEYYVFTVDPFVWRSVIVGRSTFQQAKSCIGTSKCEVVVGPTGDWSMVVNHLRSIPKSQISILNILSPPAELDFTQIPAARVLRIFGRDDSSEWDTVPGPPYYTLPTSVLASTRELHCHHALPVVSAPILSVTSFSLTFMDTMIFPDLVPLVNFPNLTAVVLSANIGVLHPRNTFTPLHHASIKTLSITDTVIPHLCALLQRGALSLSSLTHFILLDIFPSISHSGGNWSQLQSLLVNVTCFDIRAATKQNCRSDIRQLLDVMPLLQQFGVFGDAVNDGLQALLITPIKRIGKLVVSDSNTDGLNVKVYYDKLSSQFTDRTDDITSIQLVNCPHILPRIREQLSW